MILKVKGYFQGVLDRETNVYTFTKSFLCHLAKKDSLPKGEDEIETKFKHVKNKINKKKLKQRIRYRFPKHETIDYLEIVFAFDLETYNEQKFAETYAAGLHDVNRLRDRWDRG